MSNIKTIFIQIAPMASNGLRNPQSPVALAKIDSLVYDCNYSRPQLRRVTRIPCASLCMWVNGSPCGQREHPDDP